MAETLRVESLQARIAGDQAGREINFVQEPASTFHFSLDLDALYAELGHDNGAFDFYLSVRDPAGKVSHWRLGNFISTDRDEAIVPVPIGDTLAWTHVTSKGNVSLHFGDEPIRRIRTDDHVLTTGRRGVTFSMTIHTHSRPVESMVGTWNGRQSLHRAEFPVTYTEKPGSGRSGSGLYSYVVKGSFHPGQHPEMASVGDRDIDPYVEMKLSGLDVPANAQLRCDKPSRRRIRDITAIHGDTSQVFLPSFTFRVKRLAFQCERFRTSDLRFMKRLRWISWAFVLIRPFAGIWLVGEMTNKAQDNGSAFFRWLRTERPERRAYYVIDTDSPDRHRVEPYGNVLIRHSRRHILYSLLASRFVSSHHAEYLFASRMRWFKRRCRGWRVFLQHGVISTKDIALNYGRRFMAEPFDAVVVSSDLERQIVIQELEYLPSQVKVTGLARFDTLFADDVPIQRRILIMPTWRDWLSHRRSFENSEFLRKWSAFLQHPQLAELAAEHDLSVELILHPNMQHFTDLLDFPGITIRRFGEDIQSLLKSGAVLITDYSSVHWDFSFLERPILYFQFDRDFFLRGSSAYVDIPAQFPGDIAYDEDALVARLRDVVEGGMQMSEAHRLRSRNFLKFRDGHNCERIEQLVLDADTWRIRLTRLRSRKIIRTTYDRFRGSKRYHRVMTWVYQLAKLLPRKPLIVFESDQGRSYGGSPRALHERLLERGSDLEMAVVNNALDRVSGLATRKIRRLSPRYYWDLGRARYWVFNQNVSLQFKPSRRTYFLQTWHGTPLKRMQQDLPAVFGRDAGYLDRVRTMAGYWSALVSPSTFATQCFRTAFAYDGPVLETGYPVNDVLRAPDADEKRRAVRQRLGIDAERRVVLYAPTFRDDQRKGNAWAAEMLLDIEQFAARLGDDTTLLVRFHPLVRQRVDGKLAGVVLDVSKHPNVQELLLATDVLITDYSSIMFDFALTGRPMVFFTYDLEHYRDDLRGFYFDFEAESPGPLVSTSDEVIAAIKNIDAIRADYAGRYDAFTERFNGLEDGHASDRVLDLMLGTATAGPGRS